MHNLKPYTLKEYCDNFGYAYCEGSTFFHDTIDNDLAKSVNHSWNSKEQLFNAKIREVQEQSLVIGGVTKEFCDNLKKGRYLDAFLLLNKVLMCEIADAIGSYQCGIIYLNKPLSSKPKYKFGK